MSIKLGIGSAQFGLDYGITNKKGQLLESEVKQILNNKDIKTFSFIDTASSYGNAERLLGKILSSKTHLKVITKIGSMQNKKETLIYQYEKQLQKSLLNLKKKNLYGLLLHKPSDLKNNESQSIYKWLRSLKEKKVIKKIGISIYQKNDLENIPKDLLNIVQLPLSIYDQSNLLNGTIEELNQNGSEIHIRSLFLQGLILQESKFWPIKNNLKILVKHHQKFYDFLNSKKITPLEATLEFVNNLKNVDAAIIGISSLKEFNEIINAYLRIKKSPSKINYYDWQIENKFLDPRQW